MATFKIPVEDRQAECSVFELMGRAGGLVDNVNRWRRQLGLMAEEPAVVEASALTATGHLGAFQYFRLINESAPDKAFLVALLPSRGYTLFVKGMCAAADLPALESGFLAFCQSIQR